MKKPYNSKNTRLELLHEFESAPYSTLFSQITLCAVLNFSPAKAERDRWAGTGVPFIKIGHSVRYRKSDIVEYLKHLTPNRSTVGISPTGGKNDV